MREQLYKIIKDIISKTPKRDLIVLAGDFNTKTGSRWQDFKGNIGKFCKGMINKCGQRLLQTRKKEDLIISNRLFNVKQCDRIKMDSTISQKTVKEDKIQ